MTNTNVSVRFVNLTVKLAYTIKLSRKKEFLQQLTFVHLRYNLGGDRPSQTTTHVLSYFQNK